MSTRTRDVLRGSPSASLVDTVLRRGLERPAMARHSGRVSHKLLAILPVSLLPGLTTCIAKAVRLFLDRQIGDDRTPTPRRKGQSDPSLLAVCRDFRTTPFGWFALGQNGFLFQRPLVSIGSIRPLFLISAGSGVTRTRTSSTRRPSSDSFAQWL